jgi:hypothetical protein
MERESIKPEVLQALLNLANTMELANRSLPMPVGGQHARARRVGTRAAGGWENVDRRVPPLTLCAPLIPPTLSPPSDIPPLNP